MSSKTVVVLVERAMNVNRHFFAAASYESNKIWFSVSVVNAKQIKMSKQMLGAVAHNRKYR